MKFRKISKRLITAVLAASALSITVGPALSQVPVYAEDTAGAAIPKLEGEYTDRNISGAQITIRKVEGQTYAIGISGPAGEDGTKKQWALSGTYNAEDKVIRYTGGVRSTVSEDGITTDYTDGTGSIVYKDGVLFWNSNDDPEITEAIWDKVPGTTEYEASASVYPGDDGKEHGTISIDKTTYRGGTTVTVTLTPEEGFVVYGGVSVRTNTSVYGYYEQIEVTKVDDNTYTFTAPEDDVQVSALFTKDAADPDNTDPSEKQDLYYVTDASVAPTESDGKVHGTIMLDKGSAGEGELITVTVTPDKGYEVDGVGVVGDGSLPDMNVTKTSDTTYTFLMPASNVEVTAYIIKTESSEPETTVTEETTGNSGGSSKVTKTDDVDTGDRSGLSAWIGIAVASASSVAAFLAVSLIRRDRQ